MNGEYICKKNTTKSWLFLPIVTIGLALMYIIPVGFWQVVAKEPLDFSAALCSSSLEKWVCMDILQNTGQIFKKKSNK